MSPVRAPGTRGLGRVGAAVTVLVAAALVALLGGCRASSSTTSPPRSSSTTAPLTPLPGDATVQLLDPDLVFAPARVAIHKGSQVIWKWPGGAAHNVTFAGFASGTQTQGTFKHTFDAVGTFTYECTLHSADGQGMIGAVVVVP